MTNTILRLDASARRSGSASRAFADAVFSRVSGAAVVHRDLAEGIPQISEGYAVGTFKAPESRNAEENAALALSDVLLGELQAADTLVIAAPIYNFNIPASLKAWIDQVTRAGVAFRYTKNGPEGLLKGKQAIVVLASGGTKIGAPNDFATPYLRHALGFIGIDDVTFIQASRDAGEDEITRVAKLIAPRLAA